MKATANNSPFLLPRTPSLKWVAPLIESLTGLKRLHKHYENRPNNSSTETFLTHTLDALGIQYETKGQSLNSIPKTGPLLIVANHPLGGVEGVILAKILLTYRPDLQVMANLFLKRITELDNLFIGVDVFDTKEARKTNLKAVKSASNHLQGGGALLIFPAGEVSTFDANTQRIQDKEWGRLVGRLARTTKAQCLPIYIEGENSKWFYRAGKIHPRLRTLLLGRELLNKKGSPIGIKIGDIISPSEIQKTGDDQAITHYLRLNTYLLSEDNQPRNSQQRFARTLQPIQPDIDQSKLQQAIESLDDKCLLLIQKQFKVYIANANQLGLLLQQIGIIRERNFRDVGEGTGNAIDLDDFDQDYLHLFVWDQEQLAVVGAYRLGLVTPILASKGLTGLYSRTLFNFDASFLATQPNAIEMGRSVIDAPYQKSLSPLMLLWKGIGTFIARNPQYQTLFGPVSISGEYKNLTHQLIVSCLTAHHYDHDRARLVKATHPVLSQDKPFWSLSLLSGLADIQLLSNLVSRLEKGAGVPVLIRQYLSLKGRFISFNVDPDFNQTIDGLITVNLPQLSERVLSKYMGKEAAERYLAHHQKQSIVQDTLSIYETKTTEFDLQEVQ